MRDIAVKFEPPLNVPARATAEINVCAEDGHARIIVRSIDSSAVFEVRPDCQMIEVDGCHIIVAAPGSIRYPKLNWRQRLLHWLAK